MSSSLPPDLDGLDHVQPLGSGGYADVFLYEQQMPRMKVAVKVLKSDGLTPAIKRQFIDEANTMAQLADHPYIVQVFRSGTSEDGRPFLVMKYYPPPNLAQRARSARFSVEEVLRTGIHLASAVETAHRAGVIHRDIKPANVLVSQYGTPGLTDFGIAGRGGALEDLDDDIGVSVPWAPPEVLFGQTNGDARADVYSLAATLWQLLVGRSPFEVPGGDNSTYALMPRIRSNPPPGTGRADVPQGMERLLAQAMAKNPLARPGTALELARSLQQIEQEERFSRTAIVVLDELGHSGDAGAAPVDTRDRTRLRASSGPTPRPSTGPPGSPGSGGSSVPPPTSGAGGRPTTPPPPLSQPVIGGRMSGGRAIPPAAPTPIADGVADRPTGQGATAQTSGPRPDAGSSTVDAGPGRERRPGIQVGLLPLVASVIGVLVVLAVVAGTIWWTGRDADAPVATTTETGGQVGGLAGQPTVTLRPGKEGDVPIMTFAVGYDDIREGDTLRVRFGPGEEGINPAEKGKTLAPGTTELKVSAGTGTYLCGQSRVTRGDQTTAWSAVSCERSSDQ